MPITVLTTEGVLDQKSEQSLFAELTELLLKHHQLTGNAFLKPNVIGEITTIPKGKSFAGGKPADIAIVQLKMPSFAFSALEQKQQFVSEATEAVVRAAQGRIPRNHVWVNMVFAVEGMWGIDGRTYTNSELLEAVSAAAA
jgi:phenylpyruvate tautomerase PptA (4-oxalocrotonate tautomerase family)